MAAEPGVASNAAVGGAGDAAKAIQAERNILWVRTAMISFNIIVYYLVMDKTGTIPTLALAVSVVAASYALIMVMWRPYERLPSMRTSMFTVVSDSILIYFWLLATGGADSPFVFLWTVSLVAVAFRFDHAVTFATTSLYVILDVAIVGMDGGAATGWMLARAAYIGFTGTLLGLLARDSQRAYDDRAHALVAVEKQRLEVQHREAEEARWKTMAEASVEGLVIHRHGVIVDLNDSMARIMDMPREALVGKRLQALAAKGHEDEAARAITGGGSDTLDSWALERSDGQVRFVESGGRSVWFQEQEAHVLSIRDVTRAREAMAVARRAMIQEAEIRRLQEVDQFKTDFINTAAHELNTPLTPLMIQLNVLRRSVDHAQSEAQGRSVEILERNLRRLAGLVSDMMDVAKLQGGRLKLDAADTDVTSLMRAEAETFFAAAADQDIDLQLRIEDGLQAWVDDARLSQVVSNLLSNAIKFTPGGGTVTLLAAKRDGRVEVEVTDTGIGLTRSQRERLFKPFVRVHETASDPGGTGLGLYISHNMVKAMGGELECRSEGRGKGVTFAFDLPTKRVKVAA